jgi:hypothetical protein
MQPQRPLKFRLHSALEHLPPGCRELFESEEEFSLSHGWFRNMIATGLAPYNEARFGLLAEGERVIAILPLQFSSTHGYSSLTNCYSCLYRPLMASDRDPHEAAWSLGREFCRLNSRWPLARIDCLPADWPAQAAFSEGLNAGGIVVRKFEHFGNWHEALSGRCWAEYLASRPGNLRELLRRRRRQNDRVTGLTCEIVQAGESIARGIHAFETIYARSWKPSEPFPRFNAGIIREAAHGGALRLGICWQQDKPVAVQVWVVRAGVATVLKLAHDEEHRGSSPGTVLTAAIIEQLIGEGIAALDFGRGDDPYKRLWVSQRRQRIGLLLANPRRTRGILALLRHDLGRLRRRQNAFGNANGP